MSAGIVPTILDTALKVQSLLLNEEIKFCFIGGLAVQRWSEARVTRNVDLTLFAAQLGQRPRLRSPSNSHSSFNKNEWD